jgi:hypothetical protein
MIADTLRNSSPHEQRVRRFAAIEVLSLFLVAAAGVLGAVAEENFHPQAVAVIDGYVEATGGEAAYAKLENRISKATMEFVGQGIELPIVVYQARPNRSYTLVDSEVVGRVEKGTDGETVWEVSVINGPQIKEGEERAVTLRSSWFDGAVNWRPAFDKAEHAGMEEIDGRSCHKIVMTPKQGQPETRYYDAETNLLVKVEMTLELPVGTIPLENHLSDYRQVDGILLPFEVRVFVIGQERRMTVESVEHNVELPEDRFDLPTEIQDLLAKRAATAG